MPRLEDALARIKRLECPTGDVEYRVARILEDYGIVEKGQAAVSREPQYDREGAQAYRVTIQGEAKDSLLLLAESGPEDYVAKVVDAYIH